MATSRPPMTSSASPWRSMARGSALLTPKAITAMETTVRPPAIGSGAGNAATSFGLAWNTPEVGGGHEWSHAGALEGSTASWMYRSPDGVVIAWSVNTLPSDLYAFLGDSIGGMLHALPSVTTWPETDLFASSRSNLMA